MSFMDQKPRIATQDEVDAPWGGSPRGKRFRCYLCGYKLQVGDQWRWIRGVSSINFIVCQGCNMHYDSDDNALRSRMQSNLTESEVRFWWLYTELDDAEHEISRGVDKWTTCPRCKEEFQA